MQTNLKGVLPSLLEFQERYPLSHYHFFQVELLLGKFDFGNLEDLNLFFISDISGLLGGLTRDISYLSFIALSLVPICMWILWSTPFGFN